MAKISSDVKKYIDQHEGPIKGIIEGLRKAVLEADPKLSESIKWKNLFFEKSGYVCALVAHKDHVNLEFWKGTALIEKGHDLEGTGKSIRHKKYYAVKEIKKGEIKKMIRDAVRIN